MENILSILPTKYRDAVLLVVALGAYTPFLTRAFYALKQEGGLKGILSAIWLGTNTPKGETQTTVIPSNESSIK